MFLNDVHKKEEIRNLAVQDLRTLGIKYRPKKPQPPNVKDVKKSGKVFGVPLQNLSTQTVTLKSGQQLVVPKLVHEMCSFILSKVSTEGLFRKGGSRARQTEIKLLLDAGCHLGNEHHEIDVASMLKMFLRDLPEPIFPVSYHDLFLKCAITQGDKLRATLLSCLLLPCEHLNILAYLMQFLNQVTQFAVDNKMDSYNLAVVMVPNLMPVEEKLSPHATYRITRFSEVFKLLVENASLIGLVPDDIIERIALSSSSGSLTDDDTTNLKKKKKRRSGSLTRMFNGLKKIVSSKSTEDNLNSVVTPDLLLTPCMTRSAKKRKFDGAGFSMRKKKEIMNKLPQSSALCTPYTALRTPVNSDPNPKKIRTPETTVRLQKEKVEVKEKEKKTSQWLIRGKSKPSSGKQNDETASVSSRSSLGTKAMLERRWSQVSSQVAGFRKGKKRNSCGPSASVTADRKKSEMAAREAVPSNAVPTIMMEEGELKATPEPDYVKISRTEYEEIKSRVSEIERRISIELESEPTTNLTKPAIQNVQNAYEQTLVQVEHMSPTTDQLAKRLSRELKIRRSAEQKIIRSPSARKIGSIRRRSREADRSVKLNRHQSWHVTKVDPKIDPKSPQINQPPEVQNSEITSNRYPTRSSSFHNNSTSNSLKPPRKLSDSWKNGENFFDGTTTPSFDNSEKCRASLIRLRNQNAGMVMAKARLFDDLVDSDGSSNTKSTPNLVPRVRTNKVGAARPTERQSYRIRALKAEERRSKKSMSPRRRTCKSPNSAMRQQRLQVAKSSSVALMLEDGHCVKTKISSPLKDYNFKTVPAFAVKNSSPCATPRSTPHIKRPFNIKSPKRLNRTPLPLDRTTPLKVIVNNRQQF